MTVHTLRPAELLPAIPTAYRRVEIANALRRLCQESERYWYALSASEFVEPMGTAWSPADHVRHLTKSLRPVAGAMRMPRWVLRFMYGTSTTQSRGYRELVATYHEALRNGGRAGRYAPELRPVVGDATEYRRRVLGQHHAVVDGLAAEVMKWSHAHIDSLRLPHPLLGMLTVREMALWSLYHNLHHVLVVARRRGEYFTDETPLNS
jgi:hypothetical protein